MRLTAAISSYSPSWRLSVALRNLHVSCEILRERAVQIRRNVTDQLAALAPQVMTTSSGPPPDPERYPISRLMTHAEWLVGRLGIGAR